MKICGKISCSVPSTQTVSITKLYINPEVNEDNKVVLITNKYSLEISFIPIIHLFKKK